MTDKNPLRFSDLHLIDPLLKALLAEGYEEPTPIQREAIPHILQKRDLLGCAQTGTGKTAAFALPILQLLNERPTAGARPPIRVLVLTPTRELAAQIGESFERYGANLGLRSTVIFGGVGQGPQTRALRAGVPILVATPGRLLDLMDQRFVDLSQLEIFVLDEADRMLDMGFVHDVKRVIKVLPKKRHSLFFSATMPPDIQRLANDILTDPVKVEVTPVASTAEKITQSVFFVEKEDKRRLLEQLMLDASISRALVFTRTKHGADRVAKFLNMADVAAEAIHGNKSQNNRIRALNNFKAGNTRVLVATDIAARGIDIDGVTHVINFELPNVPESYVHRIGRTARAGAEGIALSFCDREEKAFLVDIERLIRQRIPVVEVPGFSLGNDAGRAPAREPSRSPAPHSRSSSGSGGRGGHSSARSGTRRPEGNRSRPQGQRDSGAHASGAAKAPPRAHGGGQGRRTGAAASSQGRAPSHKIPEGRVPAGGGSHAKSGQPWWKKLLPGKG